MGGFNDNIQRSPYPSLILNVVPHGLVQSNPAARKVKTTSGLVLVSYVTTGAPQSGSIILPQGTYSYYVKSTASAPPPIAYSVQCLTQYPFTYNKYDALNRLRESGEFEASDASSFTQTLADSSTFPSSSVLLASTFTYDTSSSDVMASGQRNLKGRLSWSCSYRLGTLALSTFYSYDDLGRIEWIVQKGLGSAAKKIAYVYDQQGNIKTKTYTDSYNSANNYYWGFDYDAVGRLARAYSGADSSSRIKEAEYTYLAYGKVNQLKLGATPAQSISYTYNERDWLGTLFSTWFWEHLVCCLRDCLSKSLDLGKD